MWSIRRRRRPAAPFTIRPCSRAKSISHTEGREGYALRQFCQEPLLVSHTERRTFRRGFAGNPCFNTGLGDDVVFIEVCFAVGTALRGFCLVAEP